MSRQGWLQGEGIQGRNRDFRSRQGGLPTRPVLGRDMGFVSRQRGLQFKTEVCRDKAFSIAIESSIGLRHRSLVS